MPRRLSDEDIELWQRVAQRTRRLRPAPDPAPPAATQRPVPDPGAPRPRAATGSAVPAPQSGPAQPLALPPRLPGRPAPPPRHDLSLPLEQRLASAPPRLDGALHRRLSRGKLTPEARIDLHGMTRARAQAALTGFLLAAQARGQRLVLVITGKGRSRDDDTLAVPQLPGALRHELPHWVSGPALRAIVVDLRPAHRSHGGGGAFYVYLRRIRPADGSRP
jgi:DNA-nicking Smr family endonuclease